MLRISPILVGRRQRHLHGVLSTQVGRYGITERGSEDANQ